MSNKKLFEYALLNNIAEKLDSEQLGKIAKDVIENAGKDDASRSEWMKRSAKAMDMALQVIEEKNTPWTNASNVKYPLLTTASLQFHARAYPAIINGNEIVKGQVTGNDPSGEKKAKADRMAQYRNWDLLENMEEWEEQVDKMLLALPIEGCEFKKTYFDPNLGRNVSEWVRPENIIVNNKAKDIETCPRVTHRIFFYPQQIIEKQRAGIWLDSDLGIDTEETEDETLQEFYEQHCLLDLDDDGYKEPYYVTVHKESEKIVRIKARFDVKDVDLRDKKVVSIKPKTHFTKFTFLPSPDGSFYDIGFGWLIGPLSDTIDTTINQMIDAGTLANKSSGFVRQGVTIDGKRGDIKVKLGEFPQINVPAGGSIRDAIYQFQFPGPSSVLFNLLSFLVQAVNDITSIQDVMTGRQENAGEPMGTTLARLEQGMQVFVTIYKRIYRALKKELRKLKELDKEYLQPETYFNVLDTGDPQTIFKMDFMDDGTDVQLVCDPTMATNTQRIAKAQMLYQLGAKDPDFKGEVIKRRLLEALQIPNTQEVMVSEEEKAAQAKQPNPAMMELEAKLNKMSAETNKILMEAEKSKAEMAQIMAKVNETFANINFDKIKLAYETIDRMMEHEQGRVEPMENEPNNPGGILPGQGLNFQGPY